jgi:hypothetical protein
MKRLPLLLAAVLLPVSCDDGGTGPEEGNATLSVYLTDAPGDVQAVWVELIGLTAQGGEGGPVELLSEPTDLILLTDLVGTVQLLNRSSIFDPTTISQLRLVVGDAVLQSKEGTVYVKGDPTLPAGFEEATLGELQCPSCSQSGIKVKIPNDEIEVEEGTAALVLDFVVSQSFGHKAGNSGKWVMHPVIHGTLVGDENGDGEVLDDLGLAGSISGTVTLAGGVSIPECPATEPRSISDFIPTAALAGFVDGEGQQIVRAGTVAEDGSFQIGFLPAASYHMGFVPSITLGNDRLTFTADVTPSQVTISAENVTGVAFIIQSAICQPAG